MSTLQALYTTVCDPSRQPHPFVGDAAGLADAIALALSEDEYCLCERDPAHVWTDEPGAIAWD